MNVFVKSFGRPYYLDRCLRSLRRYLTSEYSITVLDDGTAPQYLELISSRHPEVTIEKSNLYEAKRQAVEQHLEGKRVYNCWEVPVAFWRTQIAKAGDFFLLMEDDGWLTSPLDVPAIGRVMKKENIVTTKIYWGGCDKMVSGRKAKASPEVEIIYPELPVESLSLMKPFLENRLKIRSLLLKAGFLPVGHLLPYYTLYSVASAFFSRDYWLFVTENADTQIRETDQLLRAMQWRKQHSDSRYARTPEEKALTTYQSSAYNPFANSLFDMLFLNNVLSQAWFAGDLDSFDNFPADFPADKISNLIRKGACSDRKEFSVEAWIAWVDLFSEPYRAMGFQV